MSLYFFFTISQIYIFYGTRSNAEFVIHSGFFFDNNSHDRVKIKLGVSKSDRLYAMKAEVLARAGIPTYVEKHGQLALVVLGAAAVLGTGAWMALGCCMLGHGVCGRGPALSDSAAVWLQCWACCGL